MGRLGAAAAMAAVLLPCLSAWAAEEKKKDAFQVSGYVSRAPDVVAARVVVKLVDAESGKATDMAATGVFGKFKFSNVKPGQYYLECSGVRRELLVKNKNVRADMDLSAPGGVARSHTAEKIVEALAGATAQQQADGAGPAPGPNDQSLQQALAGAYWGYSGSTEARLALCASGQFSDQAESSYSGTSRDSLGNQTMAWGTASRQGSSGRWSVQGTPQQGTIQLVYQSGKRVSVPYRMVDRGCYNFAGRTLCRTGDAPCR